MTKILAVLILTVSLLFVINCGSKKVPKDLSDEQLYDAAMKELTADKGGFPWIFRGRDYDMIFAYLERNSAEIHLQPLCCARRAQDGRRVL